MFDGLGYYLPAALISLLMGGEEAPVQKLFNERTIVNTRQAQTPVEEFSVIRGGVDDRNENFFDEQTGLIQIGRRYRILQHDGKKCGFARYKTIQSIRHLGSYAFVDRFSIAFWHLNSNEEIDKAYEALYQSVRNDLKFPRSVELIIPETDLLTKDWCSRRGFKKLKKYDNKPYKSYLMSFRKASLSDQTESD